ncbi:TetR/AcrR family transcriptional regulator [Nocardioides sp. InS609-2]|uniref:TetR/AcrR family transcriptional regulator n=1 Tax=Nocardioides sp. InS609-2 TaxID=2760705 RepID=UPI0020BDF6B4|nr:TetR/AcrR family transcriptional regulator [Nocardioides sp. InS609-2]
MDETALDETDGRLRRGSETRRAVLARAVQVASLHGLDGISIGQLATDLSISKSGLFARFGAKEELQLATIRAARAIYADAVVAPAMRVPPGLARVWALSESWIAYSQARIFRGGCFFARASLEFGGRPGAVRDALVAAHREWMSLLGQTLDDARLLGELLPALDVQQLAFELQAVLDAANVGSLLDDEQCYAHARAAAQQRLQQAVAPDIALPWDAG